MMNCAEVRRLAGRFLALELERGAEGEVRDHLRQCGSCREMVAAQEPAQAVVWLAESAPDVEDDHFVGEVMAGIHQRRLGQRLGTRRRYLAVAAALLVAVLAGTMTVRRLLTPTVPAMARLAPAAGTPLVSEPAPRARAFVEIDKAGVRLYQLTPASDARGAIQVAFIVDPHVEL
ncbi:MAG: zf-HC2 domain-containing protein [Thermoanaerobaculales bacterium]